MKIPIDYPGFEGRNLVLCTENYFRDAKIMIDGRSLPRTNDCYLVRNNQGEQIIIRLAINAFVPDIFIEGEKYEIKMGWSKFDWLGCCLPLVLCISGPLWSLVSITLCLLCAGIYRSDLSLRPRLALYLLSTLVPFLGFILTLVSLEHPADIIGW